MMQKLNYEERVAGLIFIDLGKASQKYAELCRKTRPFDHHWIIL